MEGVDSGSENPAVDSEELSRLRPLSSGWRSGLRVEGVDGGRKFSGVGGEKSEAGYGHHRQAADQGCG
jgi:hypothetical protein